MRSVECGVVFYYNDKWGMLSEELCFIGMWNEECGVRSYVLLECGMRSIKCGVMFYWNDE